MMAMMHIGCVNIPEYLLISLVVILWSLAPYHPILCDSEEDFFKFIRSDFELREHHEVSAYFLVGCAPGNGVLPYDFYFFGYRGHDTW